jgi:hypothetical protein
MCFSYPPIRRALTVRCCGSCRISLPNASRRTHSLVTPTPLCTCSVISRSLTLCLTEHHSVKTYGGVDIYIHVFLTSLLIKGEFPDSRPGRFTPREGSHWIGGWVRPEPVCRNDRYELCYEYINRRMFFQIIIIRQSTDETSSCQP